MRQIPAKKTKSPKPGKKTKSPNPAKLITHHLQKALQSSKHQNPAKPIAHFCGKALQSSKHQDPAKLIAHHPQKPNNYTISYLLRSYINQVRRTSEIMHYAFYIMHSTLCILHYAFYIMHYAFYILHCPRDFRNYALCILHSALSSGLPKLCILHSAFCIVLRTSEIAHCSLLIANCFFCLPAKLVIRHNHINRLKHCFARKSCGEGVLLKKSTPFFGTAVCSRKPCFI